MVDQLIDWMIDQLINHDWPIMINWSINWSIVIDRSIEWSIEWLNYRLTIQSINRSIDFSQCSSYGHSATSGPVGTTVESSLLLLVLAAPVVSRCSHGCFLLRSFPVSIGRWRGIEMMTLMTKTMTMMTKADVLQCSASSSWCHVAYMLLHHHGHCCLLLLLLLMMMLPSQLEFIVIVIVIMATMTKLQGF